MKDYLYGNSILLNVNESKAKYEFQKEISFKEAEQDRKNLIAEKEIQKQKFISGSIFAKFGLLVLFSTIVIRERNKVKKEKIRSDELLLNILPEETAIELKLNGFAEPKYLDYVTVLFTDFKDFTKHSENFYPKQIVEELHDFFSEFDKIMVKHNIEKIKTIGDSYMAAGGLPTPSTTNAYDVVSAAIEIQNHITNISKQRKQQGLSFYEIRIGIQCWPVISGIVGINKFAYDIWGDTVNTASRMESSCEPGKINIGGATYELIKDKFNCTHRSQIEAKNIGMIDMYYIDSVRD